MIKKYLVCGKQHFFSTKLPDAHLELGAAIALELPLERYWELKALLSDLLRNQAGPDTSAEAQTTLRKIYKLAAPFAVEEKQRYWLLEKCNDPD